MYQWADVGQAKVVGDLYSPITDALEATTDAYVAACNATAEAENKYRLIHAGAYLTSEVAVSARDKHTDSIPEVAMAKAEWRIAEARERGLKAKCDELKNRLMAAMSWQRMTNVGGM